MSIDFRTGAFLVSACYLLFVNLYVFSSLPFRFIGVLVRLGPIVLLLFLISVIFSFDICLVFVDSGV